MLSAYIVYLRLPQGLVRSPLQKSRYLDKIPRSGRLLSWLGSVRPHACATVVGFAAAREKREDHARMVPRQCAAMGQGAYPFLERDAFRGTGALPISALTQATSLSACD